ncbi:MAG: hypothetical protein HYX65_08940 [Gemmatimonadetes bacterium]|nr:hypothetical protein [Gemmatimonadota bacterium]
MYLNRIRVPWSPAAGGPSRRLLLLAALIAAAAVSATCADPARAVRATTNARQRLADGGLTQAESASLRRIIAAGSPTLKFVVPEIGLCTTSYADAGWSGCTEGPSYSLVPDTSPRLYIGSWFSEAEGQWAPLSLTFPNGVGRFDATSSGYLHCSGVYGELVGYGRTGTVIKRTPMQLIDPEDCGADSLTFGVTGSLEVATADSALFRVDITPPGPMHFRGYVGSTVPDLYVHASYSVTVAPQQALLRLTCDSTVSGVIQVTRTSIAGCAVAATSGSVPPTGIVWRFSSPDLVDSSIVDASSGDHWQGPLVLSGRITVRAQLGGVRDSVSVDARVLPRPWLLFPSYHFPTAAPDPVTVGPPNPELPDTVVKRDDIGAARRQLATNPCVAVAPTCLYTVASGPNRGLAIGLAPFQIIRDTVWINDVALAPGSIYMLLHDQPPGPLNYCTRAILEAYPLLLKVEEHEGTHPASQVDSHTRIFRDAMDSLALPIFERYVQGAKANEDLVAMTNAVKARAALEAASTDLPQSPRNPLQIPCGATSAGLRFFP